LGDYLPLLQVLLVEAGIVDAPGQLDVVLGNDGQAALIGRIVIAAQLGLAPGHLRKWVASSAASTATFLVRNNTALERVVKWLLKPLSGVKHAMENLFFF